MSSNKVMNIMSVVAILMITWMIASYIDIVMHNMTTCNYAWWNLIAMFFRG